MMSCCSIKKRIIVLLICTFGILIIVVLVNYFVLICMPYKFSFLHFIVSFHLYSFWYLYYEVQ